MAYSTLPKIPLVIFGVIEPVLLIWAYINCYTDPYTYYQTQVPSTTENPITTLPTPPPTGLPTTSFPPQALSLSLQMGNVLLLLAALALVCVFSPSAATARWYLVAVAFADYGHIYAVWRAVGSEVFWNPGLWNDILWGNVGVSAVLNLGRWMTVLGVFGPLRGPAPVRKKWA